jgi:hypothetical protein
MRCFLLICDFCTLSNFTQTMYLLIIFLWFFWFYASHLLCVHCTKCIKLSHNGGTVCPSGCVTGSILPGFWYLNWKLLRFNFDWHTYNYFSKWYFTIWLISGCGQCQLVSNLHVHQTRGLVSYSAALWRDRKDYPVWVEHEGGLDTKFYSALPNIKTFTTLIFLFMGFCHLLASWSVAAEQKGFTCGVDSWDSFVRLCFHLKAGQWSISLFLFSEWFHVVMKRLFQALLKYILECICSDLV